MSSWVVRFLIRTMPIFMVEDIGHRKGLLRGDGFLACVHGGDIFGA